MTLACGATSGISVTGLTKIIYSNPSFGGTGSVTFLYLSGSTTVLTAAADVADALASLPLLQSIVQIQQFPSSIA